MTELMEQLRIDAAQRPVSGEEESDDNLVRLWQDELREAREKLDMYRSDASDRELRREDGQVLLPDRGERAVHRGDPRVLDGPLVRLDPEGVPDRPRAGARDRDPEEVASVGRLVRVELQAASARSREGA